jgi:molybdopterin adenylyltransferase
VRVRRLSTPSVKAVPRWRLYRGVCFNGYIVLGAPVFLSDWPVVASLQVLFCLDLSIQNSGGFVLGGEVVARIVRLGLLFVGEYEDGTFYGVQRVLRLAELRAVVMQQSQVDSHRHLLEEVLCRWSDEAELDLILTVGGVMPAPGPSAAERMADATVAVCERLLPGLPETMRWTLQEDVPLAALYRGVAGIRGRTLIINLPGGPSASCSFLESVATLIQPVLRFLEDGEPKPSLEQEVMAWQHSGADYEAGSEERGTFEDSAAQAGNLAGEITKGKGLQKDEFAAFLQRRKDQKEE